MNTVAVVAHGPGDLRIEERSTPSVPREGVVVRIAFGGICGSDLHYARSGANGDYRLQEPLVLGHELVGYVHAVGDSARNALPVGTPVAIHPASPCRVPGASQGADLHLTPGLTYLGSAATNPHTQGGFCGAMVVRPEQLHAIPAELDLRRAVLAEPLAIALHGIDRARDRITDARVLVSGAGPIGALVVAALQERGAGHVTAADIHDFPLAIARKIGADATLLLTDAEVPSGVFDIVVECSGVAASFTAALDAIRPGGAIIQLGILPATEVATEVWRVQSNEIAILGSQRFDGEMPEALELLARRTDLAAIVTDIIPAIQARDAFRLAGDSSRSGKVVLEWGASLRE
ncbi:MULTISPECIES: zinc-binding dehydrogenase [unclassified Pseudoclavibacter]|uniref:zinc-binding dehydrogenase n=1 Tax=unclassified Pseudoclavibacter TaxID=2615177 RepID=UPI0012F158A8|nr:MULTISPECIES: alcohol dehydrogenase catalytic domain-containing protein [unclassified Pseudoclavibacter]MBF4458488.1 alcohol dehydrogenase catalytic domain-containing protein [Pseudoclavibacter sp. VKM Ac-2867]VXB54559.1 L-idonate 5-dehydrogenase [Pseudoclavibacter sp. 8L]